MRCSLLLGALFGVCACSSNGGGPAPENNSGAGTGNTAGSNAAGSAGAGNSAGAAASAGSGGFAGTTGGAGNSGSAGSTGGSDAGTWWHPAKNTTFYWDLQNAPPDNGKSVGAYDIDGWGNDAQEVAALHALGIKVVCYMDAGTYEPGRPDSANFPTALKGSAVQGWPGELWLDVRPNGPSYATLQTMMRARFQVCKDKGFDAIEPDNIDSYQNAPGFPTTAADQLVYDRWLASTAHELGLAIFQKNDLDQIPELEPNFDGILDEQCNEHSECSALSPYTAVGKPAWDAEYTEDGQTTASFCAADVSAGIAGALFALALDGSVFEPCANDMGRHN